MTQELEKQMVKLRLMAGGQANLDRMLSDLAKRDKHDPGKAMGEFVAKMLKSLPRPQMEAAFGVLNDHICQHCHDIKQEVGAICYCLAEE